jgi:hypothetical protein
MTNTDDAIEKLLGVSEDVAWERYRTRLSPSYMTKVTRAAFHAGFRAGLEFARMANSLGEGGDPDGESQPDEPSALTGATVPHLPATTEIGKSDGSELR